MYLIIETIQKTLMQLINQLIKVKSVKKLTQKKIYYLIKRKIKLISDDKPPEAKINTN